MKTKSRFVCGACGHVALKWMGRCPGCDAWNTLEERSAPPARRGAAAGGGSRPAAGVEIRTLGEIDSAEAPRYRTGIEEFDRVLGGGLVPGSLALVAGDPGIGKSTLLLQAAAAYAAAGLRVLYVSAEESAAQIRRRSVRLSAAAGPVGILSSTRLELVAPAVEDADVDVIIVDSIQTLHHADATSAPGSVSQVRDNTLFFLELARRTQIPVLLVGHVTKEGSLAGPRVMEHMVDAVLYLEGDRYHHYRILRAIKNRFGPTHEVGVFEMADDGLREVANPSELMLAERRGEGSGSAVVVALEGTRPLLLEVQALISGSGYSNPRRVATGIDSKRLAVLLAVLEKHAGLDFSTNDVFVNVAGGFRIAEPAVGLAAAMALASSFHDRPIPADTALIGEIGLGGEVRAVSRLRRRIQEAAKLGFGRVVAPAGAVEAVEGIRIVPVTHVRDALARVFDAPARTAPRTSAGPAPRAAAVPETRP